MDSIHASEPNPRLPRSEGPEGTSFPSRAARFPDERVACPTVPWPAWAGGLVTGSADDDPSGIATYAQAGATFSNGMLWTAPATLPMMMAVQEFATALPWPPGTVWAGAPAGSSPASRGC